MSENDDVNASADASAVSADASAVSADASAVSAVSAVSADASAVSADASAEIKILSLEERDSYDLFKDTGISSIVSKMPASQRKIGEKKGEYLYSTDYEKITGESKKYIDALTFIHEGMKSGLRPSQLEVDEVALMRESRGNAWYEAYGYATEQD